MSTVSSFWGKDAPSIYTPKTKLDPSVGFGGAFDGSGYQYGAKKGFDAGKFGEIAGTVSSLFEKARSRRGYDPSDYEGGSMGGFRGGQIGGGGGGQLLDNLAAVYPQQTGPTFIPGTPASQGGGGLGSKIGALAGAALLAPFTGGMSLGAAMGAIGGASALGGTAGSLFD